jgi:hypothetical protein
MNHALANERKKKPKEKGKCFTGAGEEVAYVTRVTYIYMWVWVRAKKRKM